jgi:hypothetical protein
MPKYVLFTTSYIIEKADDWDIDDPCPEDYAVTRAIDAALGIGDRVEAYLAHGYQVQGGVQSSCSGLLLKAPLNVGNCAVCKSWVSDNSLPNRIKQLGRGTVHDGQLLCDEHLPKDHPLAF